MAAYKPVQDVHDVQIYQAVQVGTNLYHCPVCKDLFECLSSCSRHIRTQHQQLPDTSNYIRDSSITTDPSQQRLETAPQKTGPDGEKKIKLSSDNKTKVKSGSDSGNTVKSGSDSKKSVTSCFKCRRALRSKVALRNHCHDAHSSGSHRVKCTECNITFTGRGHRDRHKRAYHRGKKVEGTALWNCNMCDKVFYSSRDNASHIKKVHAGLNHIECLLCDAVFKTKPPYVQHVRSSHSYIVNQLKCTICSKTFNKEKDCYYHYHTVLLRLSGAKCAICKESFCTKQAYRFHVRRKHKVTTRNKCRVCKKTFKSQSAWVLHKDPAQCIHCKGHCKARKRHTPNACLGIGHNVPGKPGSKPTKRAVLGEVLPHNLKDLMAYRLKENIRKGDAHNPESNPSKDDGHKRAKENIHTTRVLNTQYDQFPVITQTVDTSVSSSMAIVLKEESQSRTSTDSVNADSVTDDSVKADHVKADSVKADHVKADLVKADSVKAVCVKAADSVKAGSVKAADSLKADSVKAGSVKADSVKADGVKADSVKADSVKADSVKADSIKADSIKADSVKADSVKADSVKADSVKADSVKADSVKADSVTADSVKADSVKADRVKADSVKADSVKADSMKEPSLVDDSYGAVVGVSQYACFCGAIFSQVDLLLIHIKLHTG